MTIDVVVNDRPKGVDLTELRRRRISRIVMGVYNSAISVAFIGEDSMEIGYA